jgi:hypothetical protein
MLLLHDIASPALPSPTTITCVPVRRDLVALWMNRAAKDAYDQVVAAYPAEAQELRFGSKKFYTKHARAVGMAGLAHQPGCGRVITANAVEEAVRTLFNHNNPPVKPVEELVQLLEASLRRRKNSYPTEADVVAVVAALRSTIQKFADEVVQIYTLEAERQQQRAAAVQQPPHVNRQLQPRAGCVERQPVPAAPALGGQAHAAGQQGAMVALPPLVPLVGGLIAPFRQGAFVALPGAPTVHALLAEGWRKDRQQGIAFSAVSRDMRVNAWYERRGRMTRETSTYTGKCLVCKQPAGHGGGVAIIAVESLFVNGQWQQMNGLQAKYTCQGCVHVVRDQR